MRIELKKYLPSVVAGCAVVALLSGCETSSSKYGHGETSDCSAIFETRSADGKRVVKEKKEVKKYKTQAEADAAKAKEDAQPAKVCKVLEVKIDNHTKCEIVGSDKIDSLAKVLSENKSNKVILITPEDKLVDLKKMAESYLSANGIDVKKYVDSDLFKSLKFPYKGMRCNISGKEFVAWSGDKRLIVTFGK